LLPAATKEAPLSLCSQNAVQQKIELLKTTYHHSNWRKRDRIKLRSNEVASTKKKKMDTSVEMTTNEGDEARSLAKNPHNMLKMIQATRA
jgi:hypothetical protein